MSWREHDTATSHFIASSDEAGLRLHIRVRGEASGGPPVLFVHGATFASRLYDIPHPGASWLGAAADAGFTAYALDIRGYGRSHSAQFDAAAGPYARAESAIYDIDDAVRWICARHGVGALRLAGGSWGSITTALYTTTIGRERVDRLALFAPIYGEPNAGWLAQLRDPEDADAPRSDFGPWRWIDARETRARWDAEIPDGRAAEWRNEAILTALVQSSIADDPRSVTRDHQAFRTPNGTLLDLWDAFNGRPLYDPAALTCPLLLIRGSEDRTSTRSDALALFEKAGARTRSFLEIANATHFASAERSAATVFAMVNAFLAGDDPWRS